MIKRLYDTLEEFFYYDVNDYEVTPETVEIIVKEDPETVINILLDIIENLYE